MPTESLVLGGDLGGTSTRILVVGTDGREHGLSTGDGGNPISRPAGAAAALGDALRRALAGVDPGQVQASVIGVAGWSALRTPVVAAQFAEVWADAGLTCDPGYRSDLEVAFAAGTPEPDGTVLVAGTGATAGAVTGHRLTRTADGHGWLLGDDGSGFWLGREAVRAALRSLDAGEPQGRLAGSVLAALDAAGTADRGRDRVREEGQGTPIVLAGSLTRDTPVGATLRTLLSARFSGPILSARTGVGGAAWLALAALDPALATPATHSRLCR